MDKYIQFKNAKPIRTDKSCNQTQKDAGKIHEASGIAEYDEFAEFHTAFEIKATPDTDIKPEQKLIISCDSDYIAKINGSVVSFGQYQGYPPEYSVDIIDISGYLTVGENTVDITVWHYGIDSQTHIKGAAFLCFEICRGEEVLCSSDCNVLSRKAAGYLSGLGEKITVQLGLNYHYDMTDEGGEYRPSLIADIEGLKFYERPVKKLINAGCAEGKQIIEGSFAGKDENKLCQKKQYEFPAVQSSERSSEPSENRICASVFMQNAVLYPDTAPDVHHCGKYYIFDLGCECVGILDFDIDVESQAGFTDVCIGWGEHIDDEKCRTRIGNRNFALDFRLKPGKNVFTGYFRRLGGRYIQVFIPDGLNSRLKINRIGLIQTKYPLKRLECRFDKDTDGLQEKIYNAAMRTLECCMHEHYEDCPWREQALYTLDSRNQMLCGYYAFEDGNIDFARANLLLIAKGLREDGLLSLCYPAGLDLPIPSFSLIYIIQVIEYVFHSHDMSLVREVLPVLESILATFEGKIRENGLCENFHGTDSRGGRFWNFYEWSPTMSGNSKPAESAFEAPLNAYLSLAYLNMARMYIFLSDPLLGNEEECRKKKENCYEHWEMLNDSIREHFFVKEDGLFKSFDDRDEDKYSVLTNALCVICGANRYFDPEDGQSNIEKILRANGKGDAILAEGKSVIPCTLSMNCFRYDALLSEGGNGDFVLSDIREVCGRMLEKGATTFWETAKGAEDFGGAGSLCHGWSAMPLYYYFRYFERSWINPLFIDYSVV